MVSPAHAPVFDRLLEAAHEVVVLPRPAADREAYEAANALLLTRADHLLAVWGGGTADVVREARESGIPVEVIRPPGAARRS